MPHLKIYTLLNAEQRKELDRVLDEPQTTVLSALQWMRDRGYRIGRDAVHHYMRSRRTDRPRLRHATLKVDRMLSDEDRKQYERLLSKASTTADAALAWLRQRGYSVCYSAAAEHRRRFLESLAETRQSARLAAALAQVAGEYGHTAVTEGALMRCEQIIMQQLLNTELDAKMSPKEMTELSRSVSNAVGSRERVESMRREFEEKERRAAAEAAKAARKGVDGVAIANRVRQILGVPLPKESHPQNTSAESKLIEARDSSLRLDDK